MSVARKIAFIGLGEMGGRMYPHLVKAGHHVSVFDAVSAKLEAATSHGAIAASSVQDAADGADVIITMLNSVAAVHNVYTEAVFPVVREGALLLDASTIGPQAARDVAAAATAHEKGKHAHFLDVPVSGGVSAAGAGKLTFMCGGPEAQFQEATPLLDPMAKAVFHAGPNVGDGQTVKLCNNAILGAHMAAVSEALLLGQKHGVSPKTMSDIFATTTAACWSITVQNPIPGVIETAPSSNGYAGGFGAALMLKDLRLASEAAAHKQAMPILATTEGLYSHLCEDEKADKDFSVIAQYLDHLPAE